MCIMNHISHAEGNMIPLIESMVLKKLEDVADPLKKHLISVRSLLNEAQEVYLKQKVVDSEQFK